MSGLSGETFFNHYAKLQHLIRIQNAQRPNMNGQNNFHGIKAVWTGVWTDNKYRLCFGEFSGESSQNLKLTFGITAINTVYEFEYSHRLVWKNKEPHFDDHITYKGKQIEGNTLTLILPKNDH